jgi:hypothetical protein
VANKMLCARATKTNFFPSPSGMLLAVFWLESFVVLNYLLYYVAQKISPGLSCIQISCSYGLSAVLIFPLLDCAYDIHLDFMKKVSRDFDRDFDVFAILGLGLLLLNLVLYGVSSGYILFLAITKMLAPLPKRYFCCIIY